MTRSVQALCTTREPSGVVFLVAEIIFISNSVQLLFVREGMRQDAVYFDGFVFSPPPFPSPPFV